VNYGGDVTVNQSQLIISKAVHVTVCPTIRIPLLLLLRDLMEMDA
jgi:hypothetical protein